MKESDTVETIADMRQTVENTVPSSRLTREGELPHPPELN
jgi:hypothetical protein